MQLVAGQTYVVGAQGGADYTGFVSNPTFDSRITYITDLFTLNGGANSPLVEPTATVGAPYGWFGANIELSPVPEPAAWAMMLLGAGLIGASLRRRQAPAAC